MCLLATLFFETLVVPAESKLKQREWFVQSTPPAASKMTETNGFLAALVGEDNRTAHASDILQISYL